MSNREIKFRVYNGTEFISPDYIDRAGVAWWREDSIPTNSKLIEQFTGLYDKDGKEIYEGDIIECQPFCLKVIWVNNYARFMLDTGVSYVPFEYPSTSNFTIVGNIHENKELLTKEGQ